MKRRDFLKRSAQVGALIPLASSGLMARPLAYNYFNRPSGAEDRILVLINLSGGNDGLNTVIPYQDTAYYNARPALNIKAGSVLQLDEKLGLHNSMTGIHNLFNDGNCAVINNVGYPEQNRSHFRSTDIWHTASDAEEVLFTGWLGRYLQAVHPDYPSTLPDSPFALQISTSTSLALLGANGNMGIALENPEQFFRLANGLEVEPTPLPNTLAGPELEYVRNIIQQSDTFSKEIDNAMNSGVNNATYNTDSLSLQLQIVARLINGGLPTSVYIVTLGGFDTHSGQLGSHSLLLNYFSSAVTSFLNDMNIGGNGERVVCMSYSEFGRRLNENGSNGTDHGAAAPQFVFGNPVLGGQLLGGYPDLLNLDNRGDLQQKVDFRQIYSTILSDWLGVSTTETANVLGGTFEKLPIFSTSSVSDDQRARWAGIILEQNRPNPVSGRTEIAFTIPTRSFVRIDLVDSRGREHGALVERELEPGRHQVQVDLSGYPPGGYIYRLQTGRHRVSKRMAIVR
ncbi:MAG: DUF1501 domain-containing protein [Candidatus Kapaibacterium sp.]